MKTKKTREDVLLNLRNLKLQMQRDEKRIADLKRSWFATYKASGAIEFLRRNNDEWWRLSDFLDDSVDMNYHINYIKEHMKEAK